jgi:hypothetical protein
MNIEGYNFKDFAPGDKYPWMPVLVRLNLINIRDAPITAAFKNK